MGNRNCLVLLQHRTESEYNDFVGKFYHFPKKYINLMSGANAEFVYYEPKKRGAGVYFGYGKITKIFADKKEPDHYFAEIGDYKPFSKPVSFLDEKGRQRETDPTYNVQNAVRRISPAILEEICLDGGIVLSFKADAHLIKVLGEQLIASEKVGILELIKNAYDAQASYCKVRIEKVDALPPIDDVFYNFEEYPGPVIVIEDDGTGMTWSTIENGWLRPASTLKTSIKEALKQEKIKAIATGTLGTYETLLSHLKKEHGNRIPLGEKGVGRFATHRLGKFLMIKTKPKGSNYEYVVKIDWNVFDQISETSVDLDSIGINLTRQPSSRDYGDTDSGTQLIMYGGREGFSWNEETVRSLNRSILSLNSPVPGKIKGGFKASLECPQLPNLAEERLFEDFDPIFSFDGLVDTEGVLDYTLKFAPPRKVPLSEDIIEDKHFDLKKSEVPYWKSIPDEKYRQPACGAFFLHLDVWYRRSPWIDGPNADQFNNYLERFGGISIYRDGINIFPAEWGAVTDWLNLQTRLIKRGEKMSYYNMIGNLEIDQADNLDLVDKTDREGLIRNQAYNDLVHLLRTILLNVIEIKFIEKRNLYTNLTKDIVRDPKALTDYVKQSSKIIGNIREQYPMEDPYGIIGHLGGLSERSERLVNLERSIKNLQKSLALIDEQKELLTEQAGFGLAVAVSIHEIAKIASNFYYGINVLLKKGVDEQRLVELKDASSSLRTEINRLGPLRAVRSEKRSEFAINKAIKYAQEVFKRRFQKIGLEFHVVGEKGFQVYARYGAVIQIFTNLFDNSCYWLEAETGLNRRIEVHIDSEYRTVIVADNGPGIHESILPYLFQSGYSLKMPPSGLGLYIAKYYMQSFGGDIYLSTNKERVKTMPGAQFTLDFGKVPENKEKTT